MPRELPSTSKDMFEKAIQRELDKQREQQRKEWERDFTSVQELFVLFETGRMESTPAAMWHMLERTNRVVHSSSTKEQQEQSSAFRERFLEYARPIFEAQQDSANQERLASLTPTQRTAEKLHDQECDLSHEDFCDFYYDKNWENPGATRQEYLKRAERLLEVLSGNEEKAMKVIEVLFGEEE